jgi:hypothetical protein
MSKSSLNGYTTGEHLSEISESEILDLSKKTKLDFNSGNWNTSNQLIHTVSATCKNIPYSDEAAKEARTKLFSSFGPPSVFFTISPGDECSLCIKLYLSLKMELLPQPTTDENLLISDSGFRSKLRIDNPGACARVFLEFLGRLWDGVIPLKSRQDTPCILMFFYSFPNLIHL